MFRLVCCNSPRTGANFRRHQEQGKKDENKTRTRQHSILIPFLFNCYFHSIPPQAVITTMFRSAIARSLFSARAVKPAFTIPARPAAQFALPALSSPLPLPRFYSAAAGLTKPEVQGRIFDVLKNFDKVRCVCAPISPAACCLWAGAGSSALPEHLWRRIMTERTGH